MKERLTADNGSRVTKDSGSIESVNYEAHDGGDCRGMTSNGVD